MKKEYNVNDVAIVGMACRFPDAKNYEEFWENLKNGKNSIRHIPSERWEDYLQHKDGVLTDEGTEYCRYNGILDDIDMFDAPFFNISPREARNMDPQQRILLEEVWHCIEDSGIGLHDLQNDKTSVYVGCTGNDYNLISLGREDIDSYASMGSFECMISNRVSHSFGLKGISLTLDAACASSLVSIHEAKKTIQTKESDYAIAAGVCLAYHPWRFLTFSKSRMMSTDGQCKAFDKDANGFVQGEGVAVLLLETVENALKKKHHIYGVVKGTAVNHNGNSQTITAPKVVAQKQVILQACNEAKVSLKNTTYIEAHGTGTNLGDPIEVEALAQAFSSYTNDEQYCYIGSVKTNIGHCGSAAGIAGVIKVLLMMKHRKIVQSLNLNEVNPIIPFEHSAFIPATNYMDWNPRKKEGHLVAGVSAFGFGGVNAHLILEDYAYKTEELPEKEEDYLFIISAKSEVSLKNQINSWKKFVQNSEFDEYRLNQIENTLLVGREQFPIRSGVVVKCKQDIKRFLENPIIVQNQQSQINLHINNIMTLYHNHYSEYMQSELVKNKVEECFTAMNGLGFQIKSEDNGVNSCITEDKQIESFIFVYSFVLVLQELGVSFNHIICEKNDYLLGFLLSKMITFTQAVQCLFGKLQLYKIKFRQPEIPIYDNVNNTYIMPHKFSIEYINKLKSEVMQETDFMNIWEEKSAILYGNQYTFRKNINEWQCICEKYDIDILSLVTKKERLAQQTEDIIFITKLIIASSLLKLSKKWSLSQKSMNPSLKELSYLLIDELLSQEEFIQLVLDKQIDLTEIISNMNERQMNISDINNYKIFISMSDLQMKESERRKWIDKLLQEKCQLNSFVSYESCTIHLLQEKHEVRISMENNSFKSVLLELFIHGVTLDFNYLTQYRRIHPVALPRYEFDSTRYWLAITKENPVIKSLHPMIDLNQSSIDVLKYKKTFKLGEFFVKDHVVDKKVILPGVAYIEMASAAAELATCSKVHSINNIMWIQPMVFTADEKDAFIEIKPTKEKLMFEIYSMNDDHRILHAQGDVTLDKSDSVHELKQYDVEKYKKESDYKYDTEFIYKNVFSEYIGFDYGKGFRVTKSAYGKENYAFEELELPSYLEDTFSSFTMHPSILDAALRTITWIGGMKAYEQLQLHIPFSMGSIEILGAMTKKSYAVANIDKETKNQDSGMRRYNISILNDSGQEVLRVRDFMIRELKTGSKTNIKNILSYYEGVLTEQKCNGNQMKYENTDCVWLFSKNRVEEVITSKIEKNLGATCIFITYGDQFRKLSSNEYVICPEQIENYHALYDECKLNGYKVRAVCHLADKEKNRIELNDKNISYYLNESIYISLNLFQVFTKVQCEDIVNYYFIYDASEYTNPLYQAVSVFSKSILPINHRFHMKSICFRNQKGDSFVNHLLQEMTSTYQIQENDIVYDGDSRYVKAISPVELVEGNHQLKDKGTYLITGGLGGIGRLLTTYLLKNYQAKIILTGRSQLSDVLKIQLDELSLLGGEVHYIACDITNSKEVKDMILEAKKLYGDIHCVIHCAGITDEITADMATKESYQAVLGPKVQGIHNLDMATREEPLEWFIVCSSIAAEIGDYGRGSYAYANRFMDCYIKYYDSLQLKRNCRMVSINWPIWKDGTMKADGDEEKIYKNHYGMQQLETKDALSAFETILVNAQKNIIVTYGNQEKISASLCLTNNMNTTRLVNVLHDMTNIPQDTYKKEDIIWKAINYLKEIIGHSIEMESSKIKERIELEAYGIDSIMIMELNKIMDKTFPHLSKTLFFEYRTIYDLAVYLVESYRDIIENFGNEKQIGENDEGIQSPVNNDEKILSPYYYKENETLVNESIDDVTVNDIAIVGLSGKYPMADNLDELWTNLKLGKDCITEVPKSRWNHDKYYSAVKGEKGKVYCKWGGFINGVGEFDSLFFGISPNEAKLIDPQERLFLQSAYEAIEDAGYVKSDFKDKNVGVFVGVMNGHYQILGANQMMLGNLMDARSTYASIANRVSYYFDFHGPSMAIDTMCSSSLTAIHLACNSINSNECDWALAGGVNAILHPAKYAFLSEQHFGSSEGKCRAFGSGGDGYVPAEGVGCVILKSLQKAKLDGDHIYGVIKSSKINHGGKTNGYTVPNPMAQTNLILSAINEAHIDPETISYVEAHGTGTKLGDPIEVNSLTKAFSNYTDKKQFARIGSIKANIGHTESAAGIASLTKVLLQMKYEQIVPSILVETLNENIDFESTPFFVEKELISWKHNVVLEDDKEVIVPYRSCISSFGAGGTNAHLIVEEYIEDNKPKSIEQKDYLIILSAHTDERLRIFAEKLVSSLLGNVKMLQEQDVYEIEQELMILVVEILNIEKEQVRLTENLYQYGISPQDVVRFAQMIITKYHVEITSHEIGYLETIEHIAEVIIKRMATENYAYKDEDLKNIAYTLQVGKEHMEYRLAFHTDSIQDLHNKLLTYISSGTSGQVLTGHISNLLMVEELPKDEKNKMLTNYDLDSIAHSWCKGNEFDWKQLYINEEVKRISLVTYPFENDVHWIDEVSVNSMEQSYPFGGDLNLRCLTKEGIQFDHIYRETDLIVQQHKVNHRCIVPGVVQLEMVWECIRKCTTEPFCIVNLEWLTPLAVEGKCEVRIHIFKNGDVIAFEVMNVNENSVFSRGCIELYPSITDNIETVNIDRIINTAERTMSHLEIYDSFENEGIAYGPYFRKIGDMSIRNDELLASFSDGPDQDTLGGCLCEPNILDASLQSIAAFVGHLATGDKATHVPFSIGKILFIEKKMIAYIHVKKWDNSFEVKLIDQQGNVSIILQDVVIKEIKSKSDSMFFAPVWKEVELESNNDSVHEKQAIIFYHKSNERLAKQIESYERNCRLIELRSDKESYDQLFDQNTSIDLIYYLDEIMNDSIAEESVYFYDEYKKKARNYYGFFKALTEFAADYKKLHIKVITSDVFKMDNKIAKNPIGGMLQGLLSSLDGEYKSWNLNMIDVASEELLNDNIAQIAKKIYLECGTLSRQEIVLYQNRRFVRGIKEINVQQIKQNSLRKNGVYVLLGGAGGIGYEISQYLAKCYQAKIVWIGRSNLDAAKQKQLNVIRELGGEACYLSADGCDEKALRKAITDTKEKYGVINGVFHTSVVFKDGMFYNTNEQDFMDVLDSKVMTSIALYNAVHEETLDFLVMFSSVQTIYGNVGQSNYAAGCTYQDAYAWYLSQFSKIGIKVIDWGYWGSVGAVATEKYQKILKEQGFTPIESKDGVNALEIVLASDLEHVMVMKDGQHTLDKFINSRSKKNLYTKSIVSKKQSITQRMSLEEIREQVVNCIVQVLGVKRHILVMDKQFLDYGVDSVNGLEIINCLNDSFECSMKTTILFDYPNIKELSNYLFNEVCAEKQLNVTTVLQNSEKYEEDDSKDDTELELLNQLAMGQIDLDTVLKIVGENNE